MKKSLLTLLLGFFLLSVTAQESGTFNVSKDSGKPSIIIDKNKQFDSLTLNFPVTLFNKDTKIILTTDEEIPIVVMDTATLQELGGLSRDGKNYVLSIVQRNGKYFLNEKALKTDYKKSIQLRVGEEVATVFNLAPLKEFVPYKPGYILYDALYIAEAIKKNEKIDTARSILLYYNIDSDKISTNAYLNSYGKKLYIDKTQGTRSIDEPLNPVSVMSSMGNLNVTNFADGLAKFIVARTKEELNIAFFNKFKEVLSDPKYVDLKTVFPETYGVLMVIDNQIYNYEDYLQALRNAFDRDLSDLPTNLPSIIDNHSSYFDANPGLKVILQSSFYIAQQVQLKEHPGQMIANYPVDEFMGDNTGINQNIAPSFKTLQLISKSFKSKTDSVTHYWANDTLIKKLFSDDDAVKIYIGLLEQQAKQDNIFFEGKEKKELWKIIDGSYSITRGYEEYKNFFRTVSSKIRDIEKEVDALKEVNKDSLRMEKYHVIAGKTLDLMDHLTTVEKMPYFPKDLNIAKKAGIYIYSARTASDIVIDVNRKQYASAIMKTVMLYDTIFQKDSVDRFVSQRFEEKHVPEAIRLRKIKSALEKENEKLTEQIGAQTPTADQKKKREDMLKKYLDTCKQLKKVINDYTDSKPFKKWEDSIRNELSMTLKSLLKYGTFMSAVVDAKTSDDVEAAIEAAALPVGSARIKRESTFNIALNAYCGPYMGYERVYGLDPKWMSAKKSTINSYGLTAPVGISISYGGNCRKAKNHSSYSLFLSVIDVGAIASFRFSDTTTEVLPTIQLKNILSPGIFFSYGIPTLPISVNAGWQMGPLLRKVGSQIDGNTYSDRYGRVSLSICIDIPIVNFYTFTSSKKPKYGL
jgi:hypothetical protein